MPTTNASASASNAALTANPPPQMNPPPTPGKSGTEAPPPPPQPMISKAGTDLMLPAFVIAMVALNLTVLVLLNRMLSGLDLRGVLSEKDPAVVADTTAALVAGQKAAADAAVAVAQANAPVFAAAAAAGNLPPAALTPAVAPAVAPQDVADALPASYSRIAGAFGAIVLAAALYSVANYIVWAAFFAPDRIGGVLDKIGNFFLAGSALFAPYAVNQLTSIFPRQPTAR
jgi:hypothetical protein